MAASPKSFYRPAAWIALACLVVPMFASYYFDDMFSSISYLFENPSLTALGWDAAGYGLYTSGYSVLCVFGGLVIGGILLDKWGVRVSGSLFVGMMVFGAGMVTWAVLRGGAAALRVAYVGTMLFGLGSEIAGTAVTRSIARWFKGGPMALAMGLQLAIARLGTAFALVLSPRLVQQVQDHVYSLAETARPALVGMGLMALGLILWAVFVALDARASRAEASEESTTVIPSEASVSQTADKDTFRFKDVLGVLGNKNFWLLGLLCVLFYSSIIAFKKFAGAILVPRFDIPAQAAGWMVSMLPFSTVIFAPLFGMMVDKAGKGTRWMILGAVLSLVAHGILAFAPAGVPFWGYLAMVFLGFGYSLVPAALWPSVPKIVPDKVLGTTFALIYWVQNLGLLSFKWISGAILGHYQDPGVESALSGPVAVELMFFGLCIAAVVVAVVFRRTSARHPELRLDAPNR
ncbi:MAG: MFS transporter [Bacteroidales bacterium]|nr:MFS transporter [Bacteroidales bacterium]